MDLAAETDVIGSRITFDFICLQIGIYFVVDVVFVVSKLMS